MKLIRYNNYPTGIATRSPWSGLESEIDRLFENALSGLTDHTGAGRFPVDIYEDKDNAYVRADLPGVARNDISVEVVDGFLNIHATRKQKTGDAEHTFTYDRSLTIPDNAEPEKVAAAYEDGVLTVTLPKKEEAKPRKVSVSVA
ncbi:Hsp20/alpha crystallin family protein [Opitutaceae bacterium TAV4]|uniref:Hsp20/alpha crystallin family protein n=1 Tax=Geminisphaera colitermitum TaxID=1148786 RepID=UPI000158D1D7|nr:Hsp20/alpha crystallin family protein [Geminisphaera colitermitum]RRJ94616.1 Hsp20/alpha crystallin family protein [Opitutaceae bacterium TAV4]RRJ98686.1 Hsp20/alpha crystallin family protein [Opitutaceae bacterium TAV3]